MSTIKNWKMEMCSNCSVLNEGLSCPHANILYMTPEQECMEYNGVKVKSAEQIMHEQDQEDYAEWMYKHDYSKGDE